MTTILNDNILLLESSQEFKEILINQSTRILSIFVRGIQDKDLATPPTPSNVDDFYIVASGATAEWTGKDNQIAIPAIDSNNNIIANGWEFINPIDDLRVWVIDESIEYRFNGTNWIINSLGSVPLGGTTGQGLLKNSNTDGDYSWQDLTFDAINQVLTGFVEAASATAITASDTILQAFEKTQKYITDYLTNFNGANQLVQLNGTGQLPAIDGSQLTNITVTEYFYATYSISDELTDLTTGTRLSVRIYLPSTYTTLTVTDLIATLNVAATGSNLVIDINKNGTSILTNKLSIDATETTSEDATTPYSLVSSPTTFTNGDTISFDIDQIGSTIAGQGAKVIIHGELS